MKKRYTLDEWLAKGTALFGEKQLEWMFVCPACGHVQMPIDFRPYKGQPGVSAETAHFNCIGRYAGGRSAFEETGDGPCDYTGGGLIDLRPITVVQDGRETRVFDFALGRGLGGGLSEAGARATAGGEGHDPGRA